MSLFIKDALPCPFCGGTDIRLAKHKPKNDDPYWNVFCHDCWTEIKYGAIKEDIIGMWNHRYYNGASNDSR